MTPETPTVLTVSEVAEQLRVSPRVIYDAVRERRLRCIRLGRIIRIPQSAVREFLGEEVAA